MRQLSADERELWAQVAATIRPLSREPIKGNAKKAEAKAEPPRRAVPTPPPIKPALPTAPRSHAQATLDSTWDRRLRAGTVAPDRVIDLHGRNLDQAWAAIDRGLEAAIAAGERLVLLITGHERPGEPPIQRGKIRAAVHDWLAASRHASDIAAVRNANRRHGGGGSLYVILRRSR